MPVIRMGSESQAPALAMQRAQIQLALAQLMAQQRQAGVQRTQQGFGQLENLTNTLIQYGMRGQEREAELSGRKELEALSWDRREQLAELGMLQQLGFRDKNEYADAFAASGLESPREFNELIRAQQAIGQVANKFGMTPQAAVAQMRDWGVADLNEWVQIKTGQHPYMAEELSPEDINKRRQIEGAIRWLDTSEDFAPDDTQVQDWRAELTRQRDSLRPGLITRQREPDMPALMKQWSMDGEALGMPGYMLMPTGFTIGKDGKPMVRGLTLERKPQQRAPLAQTLAQDFGAENVRGSGPLIYVRDLNNGEWLPMTEDKDGVVRIVNGYKADKEEGQPGLSLKEIEKERLNFITGRHIDTVTNEPIGIQELDRTYSEAVKLILADRPTQPKGIDKFFGPGGFTPGAPATGRPALGMQGPTTQPAAPQAPPLPADRSQLQPGQQYTVETANGEVWIVRFDPTAPKPLVPVRQLR